MNDSSDRDRVGSSPKRPPLATSVVASVALLVAVLIGSCADERTNVLDPAGEHAGQDALHLVAKIDVTGVQLAWQAVPVGGVVAYQVLRSEGPDQGGGSSEEIARLSASTLSFVDRCIESQKQYSYRVLALDGDGKPSAESQSGVAIVMAEASIMIGILETPTSVQASPGCERITVTWQAVPGAGWYRVYRDGQVSLIAQPNESPWDDMSPGAAPHTYQVSAFNPNLASDCQEGARSSPTPLVAANQDCVGFLLLPLTTYQMGSPDTEISRDSDETPHMVTLTKSFYLSDHEVTQGEWKDVMGSNPSSFTGDDNRPVERVSWYDAVTYCITRSNREGLTPAYVVNGTAVTWNQGANGYRLPTEAEWEYACRAGTQTAFANGGITNTFCSPIDANLNLMGWYCGNVGNTTHAVKGKSPNAQRLYDMHGNVWEWCWDRYEAYAPPYTDPVGGSSGSYRVTRGGGFSSDARLCRSANRNGGNDPDDRSDFIGFRLSRTAS